jgi:hypothetical protein
LLDELHHSGFRDTLRLARPKHVGRDPARVTLAELKPLVRVRLFRIDRVDEVRPVDPLPLLVVERDEEVFGVHELSDDLVDRAVELLHVLGRARQLGDAVQGFLHLLCVFAPHASSIARPERVV